MRRERCRKINRTENRVQSDNVVDSTHAKTLQGDNKQQIPRQMKKELTADKALIINNLIDKILLIILLFVHFAVLFYIIRFQSYSFSRVDRLVIGFLAFAITIALYVVIRRRLLNIWIFWAFSRVSNIHELKKRLLSLVEITEEDTLLKKIENSTEYDRKYWKLRIKFAQEHIFVDDETIPEETVIYNLKQITKNKVLIVSVLIIFLFAVGIFLIASVVEAKVNMGALVGVFPIIAAVFTVFFVFWGHKKHRKPQLILNSKGIISDKTGFHKWEEISFYIICDGSLIYQYSSGGETIKFAYNEIKLSKLLWIYSERNKLQNSRR